MNRAESFEFFIEKLLDGGVSKNVWPRADDSQLEILAANPEDSKKALMKVIPKKAYSCVNLIKRLKEDFGVQFEINEILNMYDLFISENKFWETKILAEITEVSLSESQKEKFWHNFFYSDWKGRNLEENSSQHIGNPKLSQEEFDSIFDDALRMWAGEESERNQNRKEMVQEEDLEELLTKSALVPNIDRNIALKAYIRMVPLLNNQYTENRFKFLKDKANVSPLSEPVLEEKVREFYRKMLLEIHDSSSSSRFFSENLERILNTSELSIIEDDRPYVEDFYRNNLNLGNVELVRSVEKLTGVEINDEILNFVFRKYLFEGAIQDMNKLSSRFRKTLQFDNDVVQEAYNLLISKCNFDAALKVYLSTEIKPEIDNKIIADSYSRVIEELKSRKEIKFPINYESLKWLYKKFPNETENFLKKHIKNLILSGKIREAQELKRESVRFNAEPEEEYVLACESGQWKIAKEIYDSNTEKINATYPLYAGLSDFMGFSENKKRG